MSTEEQQVNDLTKVQIKEVLLAGKCIRTSRFGSSEYNKMVGDTIVVTPQMGGREMKDVTYSSFEKWFARDILPYPTDNIEVI